MEANVLLVDNVAAYREVLAAKIAALGCTVLEARNAEEARAQFASRAIDVAVVEDDLPDESGLALVQELASRGAGTQIVSVVGPAVDAADLDALAVRIGAAKVLRGPVHPNALLKELRSILGVRSSTPPVVPAKSARGGERATVLVVADDADLIGRVAAALMSRDMSVFAVSNPVHLLEETVQRRPQLVVIDSELSDSNAYDVCRTLRAADAAGDPAVLIAVPASSPRHRTASFEAGADDFVEKPFADVELVARARAHVELRLLKRRL
jgi:DNA-binding response OmpR family regulator